MEYRMNKHNENDLKRLGFRYSSLFSSNDEVWYMTRFPVWRYGSDILLECEIDVCCADGFCRVDVFDAYTGNGRARYAGWYCRKYGDNKMVEKIDETIARKLERYGIEEVE